MGRIRPFLKEKLLVGVLLSRDFASEQAEEELTKRWGQVDYRSPLLPFSYTDYYHPEMGEGIRRRFFSFERLIFPEVLPAIKRETNELEEGWVRDGGRQVNFDPGLLNLGRIILATTKNRAHRIPLSDGIYGEVTVMYRSGAYQPLPWTYPDFASSDYREILNSIRGIYKNQIKNLSD